jgi:hypothetical protein
MFLPGKATLEIFFGHYSTIQISVVSRVLFCRENKNSNIDNFLPEFDIEVLNNKLHGLLPPGGLVSPSGRFASLLFDQGVPHYSQRHLADRNAICILHRSDCAWLCFSLSQLPIHSLFKSF